MPHPRQHLQPAYRGLGYGPGGFGSSFSYHAAKGAVRVMTKNAALHWAQRGVRVNSIAPGPVNTALMNKVPERVRIGVFVERTPLARLAEASEMAETIAFLLSPKASYINGAVLPVDGGLSSGYATARSGAEFGV